MPGLTPSELEDVPLPVKLLMRTIIGNLGAGSRRDQTHGQFDWISYDCSGTPTDVSNFYTAELMTANGWEADSTSSCGSGSATGVAESGTFCAFKKTEGGTREDAGHHRHAGRCHQADQRVLPAAGSAGELAVGRSRASGHEHGLPRAALSGVCGCQVGLTGQRTRHIMQRT